jgi:rhamnogalacturonyl hydrolase YesR
MNRKNSFFTLCFCTVFPFAVYGQTKEMNDTNTPLHLLQPAYRNPYGIPQADSVREILDRILDYVDRETPVQIIDTRTGHPVSAGKIDRHSGLQRGAFRLTSYEWGVTYAGMLLAGDVTGDRRFIDYTIRRLNFLSEAVPLFRERMKREGVAEPLRQIIAPGSLDDSGSMCAAFLKSAGRSGASSYGEIIDNYMNWIMNGQLRLSDGTLARNFPHYHSLWLDDLFMSVPAIARMGKYTGDRRYFDEAVRQVRLFASRMFVPGKNLFMHAWVEDMNPHPAFFWGRANGWAVMALVEMLDVLPETHEGYPEMLELLRKHVDGLATLQSGEGLWHQLLDRNDSYLETSATAIYTYAIARAVNRQWIDAKAYGPRVLLAWNAITKQVNEKGQVTGVCAGTGMAFDPAYYCYRPVNVFAAHGYGSVLLAGAEVLALLQNTHPRMNDNAVQFYDRPVEAKEVYFNDVK